MCEAGGDAGPLGLPQPGEDDGGDVGWRSSADSERLPRSCRAWAARLRLALDRGQENSRWSPHSFTTRGFTLPPLPPAHHPPILLLSLQHQPSDPPRFPTKRISWLAPVPAPARAFSARLTIPTLALSTARETGWTTAVSPESSTTPSQRQPRKELRFTSSLQVRHPPFGSRR